MFARITHVQSKPGKTDEVVPSTAMGFFSSKWSE